MRPRHIAYIIWIVIALLGVVSWIVPENGFSFGRHTLRWPTLTEVLDLKKDSIADVDLDILSDSLLAKADTVQLGKLETMLQNLQMATSEPIVIDTIASDTLCDSIPMMEEESANAVPFYILTGSATDQIIAFSLEYPSLANYICTCDPVTLKTIVRANPGVIVLQNGIVVDKYNIRNR